MELVLNFLKPNIILSIYTKIAAIFITFSTIFFTLLSTIAAALHSYHLSNPRVLNHQIPVRSKTVSLLLKTLTKNTPGKIAKILMKIKAVYITRPLESIGKDMLKKNTIQILVEHWSKILLHFGRKKEYIYIMVTIFPKLLIV